MRIVETRKLQKTGGSTIIVSLPKKWTEKLGLTPSSEVRLIEQTDGSLNIDPNIDTNALTKRCQILEVEKGTGNHLFRSLIGIYLTGSNEIKVLGKPRLSINQRKEIRKFSSYVIGFEIIEEEGNEVLLSDVTNPQALTFRRAIKRQYKIVRAMFTDSIRVLEGSKDLSLDIIDRDKEVDKLQWFIERQFNMMLENSALGHKISIPPSEAVFYSNVARYLERIADHSCRLAAIGTEAGQASTNQVVGFANKSIDVLDDSINSFLNKKAKKATKTIDLGKNILKKSRKYFQDKYKKEIDNPREFSIAMDVIIRTLAYSTDICETAINLSCKRDEIECKIHGKGLCFCETIDVENVFGNE